MLLYTVQSELGAYFRQNIRSLNHVFSFTSIGVRIDHNTANSKKGIYTYRAQGTMYHKIGSLIPEPSDRPRFLQMYVYDTEHELENRLKEQQFAAKKNKGKEHEQEPPDREEPLNREVLAILKAMLDRYNPYVRVIRQISQGTNLHDVRLHIKEQPTFRRTYNMPTSPQVASVLVGGEEPSEVLPRDIIVQTNSGNLLKVPDTACFYDPLQYPLLHPYGSFGWDLTIFSDNSRRISCRAYYAYMLQIRENRDSILLRGGKLLQQYVVDNYVKISTTQLRWVRDNQRTFRADWYSGVLDAMDSNTSDIGQRVILPPSYTGSPRDMHQRYHDAMALVQKYGKPDLFITMTCNPNWEEIQRELKPRQQAHDRPDLTMRFFHATFEELKVDLFTKGVLGKVAAHVHVIEFQKRGLPHAHILIILQERERQIA
ncbi:uncharacterized protein LOC113330554 [Papaver somniferum]|uniref:uncharacterized protein LOC113330554 n=1 Tax=Papaver somniferum TaxID=3469 RepID=UPI000E6F68AC|nr:uncharacterized protein LOC113330554 [Papaver somniferum]XP_026433136.1 uncharacterized protein LOC113330554 [Papaver somniferum]